MPLRSQLSETGAQSEQARQRIEVEFGLVTAEMKQKLRQQKQEVDGVQKVIYGQRSTTRLISVVLEHVTQRYKYTSKASSFDCKPTLDNLERQFVLHQQHKQKWREEIRMHVAYELHRSPDDLEAATRSLKTDRIHMLVRRDKNGVCTDASYIDRDNCIYNSPVGTDPAPNPAIPS